METSACTVFCLDNSAEAAGSGDYPPTRWRFQKDLVEFLSRAALYVSSISGSSSSSSSSACKDHYAVITAAGRPRVLIPPTADRTLLYTAAFDSAADGDQNIYAGLKLALLSTKNYSSVRVVLVTASSAAPLSSSNATALQQAFCAAGASLQVVAFCPAGDAPADLQQLVYAINTQHRTADQHTPPCPSSLLEFPEPDEGAPLWQQLEPLSQCLDPRACSSSEERRSQSPLSSAEAALSTSARAQQTLRPAARPVQNTGVTRLARMLLPRHCRYESLDTLQHLSSDGLMRSWLPSYANVSRVITRPGAPGQAAQCYIQLHRSDAPRWHKLFEVAAGKMICTPMGPGQLQQQLQQQQQQAAEAEAEVEAEATQQEQQQEASQQGSLEPAGPSACSDQQQQQEQEQEPQQQPAQQPEQQQQQPQEQEPQQQPQQQPQQALPVDIASLPSPWDDDTGSPSHAAEADSPAAAAAAAAAATAAAHVAGSDVPSSSTGSRLRNSSGGVASTSSTSSTSSRFKLSPVAGQGTLSLWQSTQHAEVFRLVWSKEQQQQGQQQQGADAPVGHDDMPLGAAQVALSSSSCLQAAGGAGSQVLMVLPYGKASSAGTPASRQHFYWLQEAVEHEGLAGAEALAARISALLRDPPQYSPISAGHMFKGQGRIVQLGPLPVSVLKEVLKAGGWEAQNDGSVVNVSLQGGGKQRGSKAGPSAAGGGASGSAASGSGGSGSSRAAKSAGGLASIRASMRRLSLSSSPLASPSPERPARVRDMLHTAHKLRRLRERGSSRGELASPVASPTAAHRCSGLSTSLPASSAVQQMEGLRRSAFSSDDTTGGEAAGGSFSHSTCLGSKSGSAAAEDAAGAAAGTAACGEGAAAVLGAEAPLVSAVPGSMRKPDAADDSLLFDLD